MKNIVVGWLAMLGVSIPAVGVVFGILRFWEAMGVSNSSPSRDAAGMTVFTVIALGVGSILAFVVGRAITDGRTWKRAELYTRETVARRARELR